MYKNDKYTHKRIGQVGMILYVRLKVLKDKLILTADLDTELLLAKAINKSREYIFLYFVMIQLYYKLLNVLLHWAEFQYKQ